MTTYILRRLMELFIVLLVVTILVFLMMRMLPGDPILIYIHKNQLEMSPPEAIKAIRDDFGLDKPLVVQYFSWMGNAFRGELGKSIFKHEKVTKLIAQRLPITIYLGIIALLLGIILGIPAGIVSAVRRGKWLDTGTTLFANLGITVPIFWFGILMIYFFGLKLRWLPIQGYISPFEDFWLSIQKVIMPAFCLAIFPIASVARQARSSMLEVIQQDYIRTAFAKGLTEGVVIMRHALKNSLIPVVTLLGLMVRVIFGGSVLIEMVFNIPGMGRLAVDAVFDQDYAIVQGVILVIAMLVTIVNLLVDISYGWIDPRIRYD